MGILGAVNLLGLFDVWNDLGGLGLFGFFGVLDVVGAFDLFGLFDVMGGNLPASSRSEPLVSDLEHGQHSADLGRGGNFGRFRYLLL